MNLLRVSAASILLAGFAAADASAQETTDLSSAPELETEPGWASDIEGASSIMAQANAVFAALRPDDAASDGSRPTPESVQVASLRDDSNTISEGNGSEGCLFMERPGSRIREWRCYYPDEGEQALNEFQFQQEYRQLMRQQEQIRMRQQQIESMIANGQID